MKKKEWNEGLNHLDPDLVEKYVEQKDRSSLAFTCAFFTEAQVFFCPHKEYGNPLRFRTKSAKIPPEKPGGIFYGNFQGKCLYTVRFSPIRPIWTFLGSRSDSG